MRAAPIPLPLPWFLWAACLQPAASEVFRFTREPLPRPFTLRAKYIFYVQARDDAPSEARDHAEVQFHGLGVLSDTGERLPASGVQVAVKPWAEVRNLASGDTFCGTPGNHAIGSDDPDAQQRLEASGAYVLVIANCGNVRNAYLSGAVALKNPHGFLPANDYQNLSLYGWAGMCYVAMATLWSALLFTNPEQLAYVHYGIAAIIGLGLAEAAAFWFALSQLNTTGEETAIRFCAQLLSTVKASYTLILVALIAHGLGVTQLDLPTGTKWRLAIGTALFSCAHALKLTVFSARQGHGPEASTVYLSAIPLVLVTGAIFFWIFRAIAEAIRRLRENGSHDGIRAYQRLGMLCGLSLIFAVVALVGQLADSPARDREWWQFHVLWSDGIAQAFFMVSLAMMMFVWAPSDESLVAAKLGQAQSLGEGAREMQNVDEEDHILVGGEDNGGGTSKGPAASTIGAVGPAE